MFSRNAAIDGIRRSSKISASHDRAKTSGSLNQILVFNASTSAEIDTAFATLARERTDALFVTGDVFFNSRRVQLVTLAARDRLPASYASRE
jgi:hypothetical protein